MTDDILARLSCIYVPHGCGGCTFCLAKAEIERLRAADDALRRTRGPVVRHGRRTSLGEVIGRWDAIADSVPCELGQRRSDAVAAEIERLRHRVDRLNAALNDIAHLCGERQVLRRIEEARRD